MFQQPSYNDSIYDEYWKVCVGGAIKSYTLYYFNVTNEEEKVKPNDQIEWTAIFNGLANNATLANFNPAFTYRFLIKLCNTIGCIVNDYVIMVTTLSPPPLKWLKPIKFHAINSTAFKFDWTDYQPIQEATNLTNNASQVQYRLERAEISFAYPPSPLENGLRLHGFNYFKFPAEQYFPEGYPYFGLRYNFRLQPSASSLVYFAGSSFAQNELTASQFYNSQPWFISNTQSNVPNEACSIYLNLTANKTYSDNKWHSFKTFRYNY